MTNRTRYFVFASLFTLSVGLGAGLTAYYTGFSTSAFTRQGGPEELQFVPPDAALVAYADVQDIMLSELRQKVRARLPQRGDGQHEFQAQTGINIETDIDHVVAAVVPRGDGVSGAQGSAMVLARGRFDQVRIEALMREHGAHVEDYKGSRLVVGEAKDGHPAVSLAFLEPGLVAVGSSGLIRGAVDQKAGGASIATNDAMMKLIADLDAGNAWAAGRFDVLAAKANLPDGVAGQLPALTYFSASANIDSGIRGTLRAEARDEEAATNLRDVVRGFLALAKIQASSRPELQTAMQALQLSGSGTTVALSFEVPGVALDALGALTGRGAGVPQQ